MKPIQPSFASPAGVLRDLWRDYADGHEMAAFRNWLLVYALFLALGITGIHRLLGTSLKGAAIPIGSFAGGVYLLQMTGHSFLGLLLLFLAVVLYVMDLVALLNGEDHLARFQIWKPWSGALRLLLFGIWLWVVEGFLAWHGSIPYVGDFVDNVLMVALRDWLPFV